LAKRTDWFQPYAVKENARFIRAFFYAGNMQAAIICPVPLRNLLRTSFISSAGKMVLPVIDKGGYYMPADHAL
jgi:hypothetical protein